MKTTAELLAEYTMILNRFGPGSPEEQRWLEDHDDNDELLDLCETAHWLKRALTRRQSPPSGPTAIEWGVIIALLLIAGGVVWSIVH